MYAVTNKRSEESLYEELDGGQIVYKNRNEKWMPMWAWQPVDEHWNYNAGDSVIVEVYTNCLEVELFVNDESMGMKTLDDFDDHIIKWLVPYTTGKLTVLGRTDSEPVAYKLVTAKKPTTIQLIADKDVLRSDAYDILHLTAQLCDEDGISVRTEEREIVFDIQGDCRLLGVDNGWTDSVQDYKSNRCQTYKGRCLLIIQSKDQVGEVTVIASTGDVESQSVTLQTC